MDFPQLKVLLLGSNDLSGSLPTALSTLGTSLQQLDLSSNTLNGTVSSTLSTLTLLTYVIFPCLVGVVALVAWVGKCCMSVCGTGECDVTASSLDLSWNKVTGTLATVISTLASDPLA